MPWSRFCRGGSEVTILPVLVYRSMRGLTLMPPGKRGMEVIVAVLVGDDPHGRGGIHATPIARQHLDAPKIPSPDQVTAFLLEIFPHFKHSP